MPIYLPFYYLCHINPQKIMEMLRNNYHPDLTLTELSTSLGNHVSTELSNHWITDRNGRAIQHLHYLPFGEDWVDQRNSSWNAPYTFSGKEKDTETGYSYFGARYYNSDLSIWLSVDPMSDKYPSLTPYAYCANNPVMLVDPDGRWIPGLDDNNNVIVTAEQGDNLESFKKFMGPDYNEIDLECAYNQMQNGQLNLTETMGGTFQLMTDAFNDAKGTMPLLLFAKKTDKENYNCTGAAIALNKGEKLDNHAMMSDLSFFDKVIGWDYQSVSPQDATTGKTILRYGDSSNNTEHAAIYMGTDNSGNSYVFSKNGKISAPTLTKKSFVDIIYSPSQVKGIKSNETGYYTKIH